MIKTMAEIEKRITEAKDSRRMEIEKVRRQKRLEEQARKKGEWEVDNIVRGIAGLEIGDLGDVEIDDKFVEDEELLEEWILEAYGDE